METAPRTGAAAQPGIVPVGWAGSSRQRGPRLNGGPGCRERGMADRRRVDRANAAGDLVQQLDG